MAYDIENTFKRILLSIEEGNSLRATLKREGMPTSTTFYDWIDNDEQKSLHYARAIESRAELKFESIEQDYNEEPQRDPESGRIDSAWVQLQRLKIDAKKWELSKLNPKKFGDKIQQELSGEVKTDTTYKIEIVKPIEDDDN
jgi:hypothetical protein